MDKEQSITNTYKCQCDSDNHSQCQCSSQAYPNIFNPNLDQESNCTQKWENLNELFNNQVSLPNDSEWIQSQSKYSLNNINLKRLIIKIQTNFSFNIEMNLQSSSYFQNSQASLNPFSITQYEVQDDGSSKIIQESLNLIQENENSNNIGFINEKDNIQQHTLVENCLNNFQKNNLNTQQLLHSQYVSEYKDNTAIQSINIKNMTGEDQLFYEYTHFKNLLISNEPQYQQQQQMQNQNYIEFNEFNQLDNNMNKYAEIHPEIINENSQLYQQQVEYFKKTLQDDENPQINYYHFYQDQTNPQIIFQNQAYPTYKENQILFQPTKNNKKQNELNYQYTQQKNEYDNSNIIQNFQESIDSQFKDKDEFIHQINNNIYEDDSHSKSYLSDQQFLMNSSSVESNQLKPQQENIQNKKFQNSTQQFNQTIYSQQIYAKPIVFNDEHVILKNKMQTNTMENYGDLSQIKQDMNLNLNNNLEDCKNQITNLDLNQSESRVALLSQISSQIQTQLSDNQINSQQNQENNLQIQTLLSIFFPKQELQITSKDQVENQEGIEINHVDKKNIVRNLIRSFIKYFSNKQKFPQIHQIHFAHQTENEAKQQFKKYFTKKKFNNHVIKQLVAHSVYGPIFRKYLESDAINYLNHSNIKCKENHQIFINFLLKCFENEMLLEKLETYTKSKRA